MRDDFEASFAEQLAAIEAEAGPAVAPGVAARLTETPDFTPFASATRSPIPTVAHSIPPPCWPT